MVLLLSRVMASRRKIQFHPCFFSHSFFNLKTHNLMIYRRLPGANERNNKAHTHK